MENYFNTLNAVDVGDKIEKKNGLSYLSWAWAWAEVKKRFPDATYTVYENADGLFYHTDGKTCWVKTGVTVNGIECIEYLPVMDFRNTSIPKDKVTSFDVNKAIQRSLTKAIARHGLGLYIYAGEDLPEDAQGDVPFETKPPAAKKAEPKKAEPKPEPTWKADMAAAEEPNKSPTGKYYCRGCGVEIMPYITDTVNKSSYDIAKSTKNKYGMQLCTDCATKKAKEKKA